MGAPPPGCPARVPSELAVPRARARLGVPRGRKRVFVGAQLGKEGSRGGEKEGRRGGEQEERAALRGEGGRTRGRTGPGFGDPRRAPHGHPTARGTPTARPHSPPFAPLLLLFFLPPSILPTAPGRTPPGVSPGVPPFLPPPLPPSRGPGAPSPGTHSVAVPSGSSRGSGGAGSPPPLHSTRRRGAGGPLALCRSAAHLQPKLCTGQPLAAAPVPPPAASSSSASAAAAVPVPPRMAPAPGTGLRAPAPRPPPPPPPRSPGRLRRRLPRSPPSAAAGPSASPGPPPARPGHGAGREPGAPGGSGDGGRGAEERGSSPSCAPGGRGVRQRERGSRGQGGEGQGWRIGQWWGRDRAGALGRVGRGQDWSPGQGGEGTAGALFLQHTPCPYSPCCDPGVTSTGGRSPTHPCPGGLCDPPCDPPAPRTAPIAPAQAAAISGASLLAPLVPACRRVLPASVLPTLSSIFFFLRPPSCPQLPLLPGLISSPGTARCSFHGKGSKAGDEAFGTPTPGSRGRGSRREARALLGEGAFSPDPEREEKSPPLNK